jgi:PAS domain S-box-containing protein
VQFFVKRYKGIPLFLNLALLAFIAIVGSGAAFTWLIRWHDHQLYARQSAKNVQLMVDSVRSRVAAPVVVRDYEQVDRIMRESFGSDITVTQAFVVNDKGVIYYDLAGKREGRHFEESLKPADAVVIDKSIILSGGMGFVVPKGQKVGRLVVASRVYDPLTDKQLSSLMHYARALISDLSAKLENNEVFAARSILANMLANSENILYVQWVDQDGLIRSHMDPDNPEGGSKLEGTKISADDRRGQRAMAVTVRKPIMIQEIGAHKGAPKLDIAIPLVYEGKKVGVVRFGYSNKEFAETRRRARTTIVSAAIAFVVFGMVLAFIVAYPIARPIQKLAAAARKAAGGDLDHQVQATTSGGRELRLLTDDFNHMIRLRAQAEKALRESEEKFRRLFEVAPDIILRWAPGFGVEYVNPAIQAITGFEPAEIVGNPGFLVSRIHPGDQKVFIGAVTGGSGVNGAPKPFILRFISKDNSVVYIEAQFIPIRDDEGDVVSVECIARDITERITAERDREDLQDQLLQMQKMEAVGQLAGGIAHDFNNMLTVVMANADLGLIYADKGTRFHQYFKDIMLATERARSLTMKLLTFARKEKVNVQDIRISVAVGELMSMLDRSINRNIRVQTIVETDPLVRVDVTQLQQALLNICTNAVDAMPDGGDLTVVCREVELTAQDCAAHAGTRPGSFCMIRITDTGAGIVPDILSKVCEPFFTTKGLGKGTGLGLSTTHGIVTGHGGHMLIESEPGKGTTVTLYVPTVLPRARIKAPEEVPAAAGGGDETILLVDDEKTVLDAAASVLEEAGYTVLKADGGRQAVNIYSAGAHDISLVVCDMIMPGMDGEETYNALLKCDSSVRVILASGYSIEGKASALLANGVRGFVQKPFTYDVLCRTVREVLDKET